MPADADAGSVRSGVTAGIRWGMIDQAAQVVVRFGTTLALARLLAPRDFGLLGLAVVVVNVALVLSGLGLGSALVQRRDLEQRHVTTAFTTSAVFGVILAVVVAAAAVPAASFFHEPRLHRLLPVLATTFVLRGLELTPNDMLVRTMRFRSFYLSSTIATVVSSALGLGLAAFGAGVWALILMMVAESAIAAVLAWAFAMSEGVWHPAIGFDRSALRDMAGFSAYVTAAQLVAFGNENGDNLVIGRVLGSVALGYYALAYRVMLLPLQRFGEIVSASAFPALAAVHHDLGRLRSGYLDAVRYVCVVCFPVTIGIAVTAPVAVPVLLGDRWRPAVATLQILAMSGPLLSVHRLTGTLARAVGRANWSFWLNSTGLAVYVPAFVIGVRHGIKGVAVAFGVATLVMSIAEFRIATRILQLPVPRIVAPIAPIAAATAAMAAVAALSMHLLASSGESLRFAGAASAGAVAYFAVIAATARSLLGEVVRLVGRR